MDVESCLANTTYPEWRCSSVANVAAGTPSMGESASAVCTGCATWKSSATTSSVATESGEWRTVAGVDPTTQATAGTP